MAYQVLDPLAQSFFIDEASVITKVDLFFASKDDFVPVFVQLRKNANGQPGSYIIPFSESYLYPADITISGDGSVASTLTFSSPIYLEIGEYSLCLGSNSTNYRVHVSELGEDDTVTGNRITEQGSIGALYKSQNASAWTPVQTEDLKFALYRAKYTVDSPIDIEFTIDASDVSDSILEENPLEIFPGSDLMRVYHPNHGMEDGSFGRVSNIEGAYDPLTQTYNTLYGVDMALVDGQSFVISNVNYNSYTITLPNAVVGVTQNTRFGGVAVSAARNFRLDAISVKDAFIEDSTTTITRSFKGTSPSYAIDSTFTPVEKGTFELDQSKIITGAVTNANNLGGGESFTYRVTLETTNENVTPMVDLKQMGIVGIQNLINNPTYDSENILSFDQELFIDNTSITITQLDGSVGTIAVPLANQDQATSFTKGTLLDVAGTSNNGKYRIISVSDDGSLIYISNVNDTPIVTETALYTVTHGTKFIAEEAATGGSTISQYITRRVDFVNPSTSVNIRLDVNRPAGSDIELYYKTKLVGEDTDLADKEFTRIPYNMPVSLSGEFIEIEKQLDNLTPFEGIIFKIAFKSTDSAVVPKCKNLRMIVLA